MDIENPPTTGSQKDVVEPSLLAMVANWSPIEVEEKTSYLLDSAKKVLLTQGSTHEDKLDCICLMVDTLMRFVPIFELEDSLLCPLLESVLEYLDEVLNMMIETEEEGRVVFFSLVCTLMENTEKVVRHCMDQECGVGEVPSLPRVVPKILFSTFSYLGMGEIISTTEQLKAQVANCFSKVRDLLILFLTLMEKIKMRTVLEDELDILISLCLELINFHDILIPLDFKLTCMVWKVYVKLTTTHQARMIEKFNFSQAPEIVSSELLKQLLQLKQMMMSPMDGGIGKVMAKVSYLIKLLTSLHNTPSCVGESPHYLYLLLEMIAQMPAFPPWMTDAQKQKVEGDVMSISVKHSLLSKAASPAFIDFLLGFLILKNPVREILLSKPFPSLQVVIHLLLQHPDQEEKLLLVCFGLLSSSTTFLETGGKLEGRQVMGKQVTMVDRYTWALTNLCSWVSSITPLQFNKVEIVLISTLLDSSSSPLTCMIVADVWCFIARYGTSQLCMAHLALLSGIVQNLKVSIFSFPHMMISVLIERLTHFLSSGDLTTWHSQNQVPELDQLPALPFAESVLCLLTPRTDREKVATIVKDTWKKLVEGSYRPAGRLWSSKLIIALSDTTLKVVDIFSNQDLAMLLEDISSVVSLGQFKQFLLVCIMKVIRVVLRRRDVKLNEQLLVIVRSIIRKCEAVQGESFVGILVSMALEEVEANNEHGLRWKEDVIEDMNIVDIETVMGSPWASKDGEMVEYLVNCVEDKQEEDLVMRKVSPTSSSSLSPSLKKRKFSPNKDDLEMCIDKLESDVEYLASMVVLEEMVDKKDKVEKVYKRLQDILQSI